MQLTSKEKSHMRHTLSLSYTHTQKLIQTHLTGG